MMYCTRTPVTNTKPLGVYGIDGKRPYIVVVDVVVRPRYLSKYFACSPSNR